MKNTYLTTFLATILFFATGLVHAAPTSENFILDSMIIGGQGTINATSATYTSESNDGPLYTFDGSGSSSSTPSTITRSNGGGSSSLLEEALVVTEPTTDHITCLNAKLVVTLNQSGSCSRDILVPLDGSIIISIGPGTFPQEYATDSISILITQKSLPSELLPLGVTETLTIDPDIIEVDAQSLEGNRVERFEKPYVISVSNDRSKGEVHSVYYLHPEFDAWIKLDSFLEQNDWVTFPGLYATKFLFLRHNPTQQVATAPVPEETPDVLITGFTRDFNPEYIFERVIEEEEERIERFYPTSEGQITEDNFMLWLILFILLTALLLLALIYTRNAQKRVENLS